ncbi:MAG TPA: glycosyltransferase family 2 protein [Rhizomicrobium sp.]|nr:glycosyltransferase family 2 protein [Rhizomicrobium sp.]
MNQSPTRIAVIVPCYNEEATIGRVVRDFRAALPGAEIFVYDNRSSDGTAARAREAGAVVREETRRGKGNVVRRMFADVEADIYVLVDGDDTYDAAAAPHLVRTLIEGGYDIVSGRRVAVGEHAYRAGHVLGNKIFTGITGLMFNINMVDMLSGYRVMSRRFVKSFPFTAEGFGIETELTVHAARLLMPMIEIDTAYKERPAGSVSKLHTWADGFRILFTIVALVREERPLIFFTGLFVLLAIASLVVGTPVVVEYFRTGLVPRLPSAVLAVALMLLGFLALASGLILDTVTRGRWELKRTAYLRIPGPGDLLLP